MDGDTIQEGINGNSPFVQVELSKMSEGRLRLSFYSILGIHAQLASDRLLADECALTHRSKAEAN